MFDPRELDAMIEKAVANTDENFVILKALLPVFLRTFATETQKVVSRNDALALAEQCAEAFSTLSHSLYLSLTREGGNDPNPDVAQAFRNVIVSTFICSFLGHIDNTSSELYAVEQVSRPGGRA